VGKIKFHTNCSNKNYPHDFIEFEKMTACGAWIERLTAFCEINRIADYYFHSKIIISGSCLANGQNAE